MAHAPRRRAALRRLALAAGLALAAAGACAQGAAALRPIASLDLPRYMGRWYEIAHLPNWFQRQCVSATQAEYRLLPEGGVQVTNSCREADGRERRAEGQARQAGAPGSATLKVRFAPAWLSALPFVWGDYWVVDLDPEYQLAAVSEPRREYLWILSRAPQPDPARLDALLARLRAQGFDLAKLERTPQPGPR